MAQRYTSLKGILWNICRCLRDKSIFIKMRSSLFQLLGLCKRRAHLRKKEKKTSTGLVKYHHDEHVSRNCRISWGRLLRLFRIQIGNVEKFFLVVPSQHMFILSTMSLWTDPAFNKRQHDPLVCSIGVSEADFSSVPVNLFVYILGALQSECDIVVCHRNALKTKTIAHSTFMEQLSTPILLQAVIMLFQYYVNMLYLLVWEQRNGLSIHLFYLAPWKMKNAHLITLTFEMLIIFVMGNEEMEAEYVGKVDAVGIAFDCCLITHGRINFRDPLTYKRTLKVRCRLTEIIQRGMHSVHPNNII